MHSSCGCVPSYRVDQLDTVLILAAYPLLEGWATLNTML